MGINLAQCNDQFLLRLDHDFRKGLGKAGRTYAEATAEGCRKLEREEQRVFSRELNRLELPFYWHRTDKPTGANAGVPDFIVGVNGVTVWIEFKAEGSGRMRPEQIRFQELLARQKIKYRLVFSAKEAIELLQFYML
jgi:hypothetical protein